MIVLIIFNYKLSQPRINQEDCLNGEIVYIGLACGNVYAGLPTWGWLWECLRGIVLIDVGSLSVL